VRDEDTASAFFLWTGGGDPSQLAATQTCTNEFLEFMDVQRDFQNQKNKLGIQAACTVAFYLLHLFCEALCDLLSYERF
jgi:hypothetical protein